MSKYDIDPVGVQAVLKKVEPHLKDVQTSGKNTEAAFMDAALASSSKVIAAALNDFAKIRSGELASARQAGWAAVDGTALAVVAYVKGDMRMMRNAQGIALPDTHIGPVGKK